ncbi:MAG: hypothetical protein BWK78_02010 [Thiotrichaceae bacterium IS1]|nr:MAG: hypothetical protein BWK78_02010 [Thiotrichaceae bacterium IS1]
MGDFTPYTTIDTDGDIYEHYSDTSYDYSRVGHVEDGRVYNTNHDYLGYGSADGKIYDEHDNCIGWVDSHDGHVYNSAGIQIYDTTKGVIGGAAYMLCVYLGGVK